MVNKIWCPGQASRDIQNTHLGHTVTESAIAKNGLARCPRDLSTLEVLHTPPLSSARPRKNEQLAKNHAFRDRCSNEVIALFGQLSIWYESKGSSPYCSCIPVTIFSLATHQYASFGLPIDSQLSQRIRRSCDRTMLILATQPPCYDSRPRSTVGDASQTVTSWSRQSLIGGQSLVWGSHSPQSGAIQPGVQV